MSKDAINSIKEVISKPNAWSEATTCTLQKIFGLQSNAHESDATITSKAKAHKPSLQKPRKAPIAPRATAKVAIHQDATDVPSDHRKNVLATQIVNAVLKNLNQRKAGPETLPHPTAKGKGLSEGSANRRPIQNAPKAHKANSLENTYNLNIIVQCGLVGFSALCKLANESNNEKDTALQLEYGLVAFATKLQSLGLNDESLQVLLLVKQRLSWLLPSQAANDERRIQKAKNPITEDVSQGPNAYVDLLDLPYAEESSATNASFLLQYELAILRLISKQHDVSPSRLITHLAPGSSIAPFKLLAAIVMSNETADKGRRTYGQLMQQLDLMAMGLAVRKDIAAKTSAFQCFSVMQKNCMRVRLADDADKDTPIAWSVFAKLFTQAAKTSSGQPTRFLAVARTAFEELRDEAQKFGMVPDAPAHVLLYLSQLAKDAADAKEATYWTEKYIEASGSLNQQNAATCAANLRMATLSLSSDYNCFISHMERAQRSLGGQLTGATSEFNLLMKEAVSFRKAVALCLRKTHNAPKAESSVDEHLRACLQVLCLISRFYAEYVNSALNAAESQEHITLLDHRQVQVVAEAAPLIDTIVFLARHFMSSATMTWPLLGSLTNDCTTLTEGLLKYRPECCKDHETESHLHEKTCLRASEICWTLFNSAKEESSESVLVNSLCRSCELLKDLRPPVRLAGSLPFKLHRFGRLLRKLGENKEAQRSLEDCLRQSLELQCFDDVRARLSCSPLSVVDEDPSLKIYFSALKTWIDIQLGDSDSAPESFSIDYVAPAAGDDALGITLEWQLRYVDARRTHCASINKIRSSITMQCLDAYPATTRPLRRQRLLVRYLRHLSPSASSKQHDALLHIAQQSLDDVRSSFSDDEGLGRYGEHLNAHLSMCVGIHCCNSTETKLDSALAIWRKIKEATQGDPTTLEQIDECQSWLQDMELVTDYYNMTGNYEQALSARLIQVWAASSEQQFPRQAHAQASIRLALALVDMGDATEAGQILNQVKGILPELERWPQICRDYHLAKAKYNLIMCERSRGYDDLTLKITTENDKESDINAPSAFTGSLGPMIARTVVDVELLDLQSRLASDAGEIMEAMRDAKRALRTAQQCWKKVQLATQRQSQAQLNLEDDLTLDLTQPQSGEEAPTDDGQDSDRLGAIFWPLVPVLSCSALRYSELAKRCGFRQDAAAAEHEAMKLARALPTSYLLHRVEAYICDSTSRAEETEICEISTAEVTPLKRAPPRNKFLLQSQLLLGDNHLRRGRWQEAMRTYTDVQAAFEHITADALRKRLLREQHATLTVEFQHLSLTNKKKQPEDRATQTKRPSKKKVQASASRVSPRPHSRLDWSAETTWIDRGLAQCAFASGQPLQACTLLSPSLEDGAHCKENKAALAMVLAKHGTACLENDAVLSMLPESTIAFPAVLLRSALSDGEDAAGAVLTGHDAAAGNLMDIHKAMGDEQADKLMFGALRIAVGVAQSVGKFLTNETLTQIWSVFALTITSLSLPKLAKERPLTSTTTVSYFLELPRNIAAAREQAVPVVNADCKSDDGLLSSATWKDVSMSLLTPRFSSDFIDMLPSTWTVLSMFLSEDFGHVYFIRYRVGHSPFLLRLPLVRQHADGADAELDDVFGFIDARNTLQDIIKASDATIETAKVAPEDLKGRKQNTAWWSKREELDHKLKSLLDNIEGHWLGGFRGILSEKKHDQHLLARFQKTFENTISKHLPSRQRRKASEQPLQFDPRIYELFVSLGDPDEDADELENALTDLLYFVVDMLQFHDEPNAYDEIDFDSMIVETQEALRSYHQASKDQAKSADDDHLVLVLDKKLHPFPWESMSCLQGKSVSRMPSILEVRDRLLVMRQQQEAGLQHAQYGVQVSPMNGTYILNPGQDISRTEQTFHRPLSSLGADSNWNNITARKPSESEFEAALTPPTNAMEPPVLLYFGHGSGLQYIRAKRIKALRLRNHTSPHSGQSKSPTSKLAAPIQAVKVTCATPLLFGCSSTHINYHGEFNPTGTPLTYLVGGAPAVLGALWDVTDGDCDVFAQSVLTKWGLVDKSKFEVDEGEKRQRAKLKKRGVRGGRRTKVQETAEKESDSRDGALCLSKAAATSRGECYLKYLNGAAMVVYGVPVYVGPKG